MGGGFFWMLLWRCVGGGWWCGNGCRLVMSEREKIKKGYYEEM